MEMERLCVLSVAVLLLREESVCGAAALNSGGGGGAGGAGGGAGVPRQRSRRSWVWNQFFILEEFTGDEPLYVGKLHSDLDKGDGQVRYVLSGDGAASVFTLDEATGDIHAARRLDREQQPFYRLRAQARDRGTGLPLEPETHFTIKVQDVNDNQPQFLHGPYSARVPESAPIGTSVLTVVASDADDPTYGNSARLVYSILQGQPYFSVEPKTGVVRTAHLGLDREVQDQYLVVVQAKDMVGQMGGLSGTTSVTVTLTDVNDNPPHFPRKSYRVTVPESAAVSSVVARIKAVDLDLGLNAEMDYRVLDGDGPGTFRVLTDPLTQEGLVVLHKALDFETKSSFTLRVEASNRYVDTRFLSAGPFSDVATVLLLVEDVDEAPVFSSAVSHMEVSEAAAVGTDVGSVSARDPDRTESPVSFSIEQRSDQQSFFTIDSRSGLIRTNRPLDRETSASHNITVLATESLDPSQVGKAVVLVSVTDVNDNAPTFATEYQLLVCEDSRPGQIIETLSAVDRDEPEDGHHFLFSLAAEAAGNLNFTLRDNKDNTVSVLSGGFHGFQQQDQWLHLVTVVISDGDRPSLSSTNTLSVAVCDCDRHGRRRSCGRRPASSLLLAVGLNATATVLACVLTLLGVVMVTAAVRHHRRRRWGASPRTDDDYEREIRENIVRYDDEGGGEEDTEAFDMSALRHPTPPTQSNPGLPRKNPGNQNQNQLLQDFIRDRLAEADLDLDLMAPPFDSLQTFAFEGSSSSRSSTAAASLCSLASSLESESEQNYDFLRDWGPKFRRLADLYGDRQGGGGASS